MAVAVARPQHDGGEGHRQARMQHEVARARISSSTPQGPLARRVSCLRIVILALLTATELLPIRERLLL